MVYTTLLHWYEAAKFMPHKPDFRDRILNAPTPKEVRKFSRMHREHWRGDWNLVRPSVLILGLALISEQCPTLGLKDAALADIRVGLDDLGLPPRFVDACLERFDAWRNGPRIALFGATSAPDTVVGSKLSKLVEPFATWTLVTTCNTKSAWKVHDWCLQHYIPVSYVGTPTDRTSKNLTASIVSAADQIIVFENRGSRRQDTALHLARKSGKKVALELYTLAPLQELRGVK